jgi:ATP-dependent Lhr-like helicase
LPDAVWASLLHARDFDRDLLDGLRGSNLLRYQFRYVANTGLLVLRRAGGRTLKRSGLQWNSGKIFERLLEADPSFPLLRETIRTVTHDLLDAPSARAYLEALAAEPRVLHPAAASPFTFGIVTSSFGDSVVIDDRKNMVEALHDRVLALLGEREDSPMPEAPPKPVTHAAGPLFEGLDTPLHATIAQVAKIKARRTPRAMKVGR